MRSILAAIFAVLSDLLQRHEDIPVLSFIASSLKGCPVPCRHPKLHACFLHLLGRETEAAGRAVRQLWLHGEMRRLQLSSGLRALAARPSFPSELGHFELPSWFIMYRIFVRRAK